MYIYKSRLTEAVRSVVPVFTFPVGAGAEAYVCWLAVSQKLVFGNVGKLALLQVAINLVGGFSAYPRFIAKASKIIV